MGWVTWRLTWGSVGRVTLPDRDPADPPTLTLLHLLLPMCTGARHPTRKLQGPWNLTGLHLSQLGMEQLLHIPKERENWLSSKKHLFLLQRTQVQVPILPATSPPYISPVPTHLTPFCYGFSTAPLFYFLHVPLPQNKAKWCPGRDFCLFHSWLRAHYLD